MINEVFKAVENDDMVIKILHDNEPESPRMWDNLGTMICWHDRYDLGDKHHYEDLSTLKDSILVNELGYDWYEVEEMTVEEIDEAINERVVMLPLYLYDHSGITMSTSGFSCKWDSGQVGVIYVIDAVVKAEYGNFDRDKAKKYLEGEVEVYDQYLTGDVYGYEIEKKIKCDCCNSIEYKEIDSCWGFFGLDSVKEGLKDFLGENDLLDEI